MNWFALFIGALAVYRLAVLFSDDDGPYGMFRRLRGWLKREAKDSPKLRKSEVHKGVECLRCTSLEFAIPMAVLFVYRQHLASWVVDAMLVLSISLALSGAAILLNRAFPTR